MINVRKKSLEKELMGEKEFVLKELARLEDEIAKAQDEWDLLKDRLSEVEVCLKALEDF